MGSMSWSAGVGWCIMAVDNADVKKIDRPVSKWFWPRYLGHVLWACGWINQNPGENDRYVGDGNPDSISGDYMRRNISDGNVANGISLNSIRWHRSDICGTSIIDTILAVFISLLLDAKAYDKHQWKGAVVCRRVCGYGTGCGGFTIGNCDIFSL